MRKVSAAVLVLLACAALKCSGQAWQAKWIAAQWSTERDGAEGDGSKPMPVFRWDFNLTEADKPFDSGFLQIAGLGQYEVTVNGRPITRPGLHESWTDYKKTILYDRWTVRGLLKPGRNVVAVMLGNGMYNVQRTKGRYTKFEGSFGPPKLTAELHILHGGTIAVIAADSGWKVARGPVMFSSTYGGEDYDARKLEAEWQQPAFDDSHWSDAVVTNSPGGTMRMSVAMNVLASTPVDRTTTKMLAPNKIVYDFGRNMAGWPHIEVRGPAGAVLRLTPGELLKPDGSVSQASSGGPQWWSYTLRGEGKETWEPRFSYFGFRYLQAEWSGTAIEEARHSLAAAAIPKATIEDVSFVELSLATASVGSFTSSNEMLNRIHSLIVSAMHNNEMTIFTDCPHREKLGWLEETHLVASGLMFNNGLVRLYQATDQNIADAQAPDGMVPTIAPQYTKFGPKYAIYDDSPEWGSAAVLSPWAAYRFYGDKGELERSYPVMQRYVKYLESKAVDGIVAYGLGDWYDIGPGGPGFEKNTTLGVTGTLMLFEDAMTMQRIAAVLGHTEDASSYSALAAREKDAFNQHFWNSTNGWYDTGSQTANAMPLALGIVPNERRAAVLAHVIADIHLHQDHVTAGEVGYPYLLRALMQAGRDDVIMAMMMRNDPPSYGSQLEAGATSLTEAWDANPKSSQDHLMLGAAEEWFYRSLGGIDFDLSRSADERITIRPRPVNGVDSVRCRFQSHLGEIRSDWTRKGDRVIFEVTVPAGARATVELPDGTKRMATPGTHRFAYNVGDARGPHQGFERATAMPRTSLGYLPETAQ